MYIYLKDNIVWEFVPEENPDFPGIPLNERYPAEFIEALVFVEDTESIEYGYIYNSETGEFSPPPVPERPDPIEPEPTAEELIDIMLGVSRYE